MARDDGVLGVGICGFGWAGRLHAGAWSHVPGTRVVGTYTPRPPGGAFAGPAGAPPLKVYRELEDLLGDSEVDIVDICSPHAFHAPQALRVCRAGKHLVLEKPIALNWREVLEVRDAVRAAGVMGCVCFELRHSPLATSIRALLEQGYLGEVHYAELDYFNGIGPDNPQFVWNAKRATGGSSLLTAGCHAVDMLRFLVPGRFESVLTWGTRSPSPDFSDYDFPTTTISLLRMAGGGVAKVTSCIDCRQPYHFRIHLVGSKGSVLDRNFHCQAFAAAKPRAWNRFGSVLFEKGDLARHPYTFQFRVFADCIRSGRPMERTGVESAVETHRLVFAAEHSLATGATVGLEEIQG